MRFLVSLCIILMSMSLWAIQDFTINGEEIVTVTVGDSLWIQFTFEDTATTASMAAFLDLNSNDQPDEGDVQLFAQENVIADNGWLDADSTAGVFAMHFRDPLMVDFSLIVVVDDSVNADWVAIHFQEPEGAIHISGAAKKESWPFDLPIPGVLMIGLYNMNFTAWPENWQEFGFEDWFTFITEKYVTISNTGILGGYNMSFPPDTTAHPVAMIAYDAVGAGEMLDVIAPAPKLRYVEDTDITQDWIFVPAESHVQGTVTFGGEPVDNAMVGIWYIQSADTMDIRFATTDSTGYYQIDCLNGVYQLAAGHADFLPYLWPYLVLDDTTAVFDIELFQVPAENAPIQLVQKMELHTYPNPFNPECNIAFSMPSQGDVQLNCYNVKGQKVKTIYSGQLAAGSHRFLWDGINEYGENVASGVYFMMLKTTDQITTKRVLLLK